MTRRARRIIFWALSALFIALSPLTVFYSKGYRFDFQKLEVFKIGGLNLQVKTGGAEIFINNRLRAQAGGLLYSGSFFKLLPRTYDVRVAKDKYHSWQKTLAVKPNLVTDVYDIILFPENAAAKELASAPADFFAFSPDRQKILAAKTGRDATSSLPILKTALLDGSGNPIENFGDFSLKWLKNPQLKILSARWPQNAESFLLKVEGDKKNQWLLAVNPARNETAGKTGGPKTKSRELILLGEEIKKSLEAAKKTGGIYKINAPLDEIFFNPQNSKELLFLLNGEIYAFNAETKIVRNPKINNNPTLDVSSFLAEEKNVWWLDENGVVKKNDLNVNLIKEIFRIPDFASSSAGGCRFVSWDDTFGIKTETGLYLNAKRGGGEFIALKSPITLARFSPDGKKLLYLKNGEAVVRFLEEIKTGDIKKAGDEDVIASGAGDAAWHKTSDYLVLAGADSIKIAELDGRSRRNVFKIAETEPKIVFYNPDNEKIYFLGSDGILKTASLR